MSETGLPELPEGYWWRVSRDSGNYLDHISVEIVYTAPKERWWTDKPHPTKTTQKTLAKQLDYWHDFSISESPEDHIRALAECALARAEKIWLKNSRKTELDDLLGDYPPKSLRS